MADANRNALSQSVLNAIAATGFDVYMRARSDSFAYFTDGTRIGYVQRGRFGDSVDLSTVHRPNSTTGTGFGLYQGVATSDLTRDRLEKCFVHAPDWARGAVSGTDLHNGTRKWRDFADFQKANAWNGSFRLVAKAV